MIMDPLNDHLALTNDFLIAHVGHYLWTLYIPPVLIVVFSIIRTVIVQRREEREGDGQEKQDAAVDQKQGT